MDRTEFKQRMKSLKSYREQNPGKGYWDWRNSLPDNLKYTDDLEYDMEGAYKSGAQPILEDDGLYHLPSRDPQSGRILKSSIHPTYWKGLSADKSLGYDTYWIGDDTYTASPYDPQGGLIPWQNKQNVEAFEDGGDNTPMWLQKPYQGPTYNQVLESLKKDNPAAYNRLQEEPQQYEKGGEVPPDNSPVYVNPITGKSLANGSLAPVVDIEDFANFTPAGSALSVRDAYIASQNGDILGLGLAGLGLIPFVRGVRGLGRGKVVGKALRERPTPTVDKGYFDRQLEQMEKERAKRLQTVDDYYKQQDAVYESMIENEDAFRRAANADATTGTSYTKTYTDLLKEYSKGSSRTNDRLPQINLTYDIPDAAKAQVDPNNLDWIRVNRRYADPNELDPTFQRLNPGLVRHELGHIVDEKSGLDYVNKLGDRSKFEPESKLKEMYPKTYRRIQDYLFKGSEIKSHMNEFREFLMRNGQYDSKETVKSMQNKLDKYKDQFKNLRILFDSYKNKRQFIKDYNMVPITATDRQEELV